MAGDPKRTIMAELLAEFVEERVRQLPVHAFNISDVTRAVSAMLRDAGDASALKSSDESWIADWLDQHPFLLKHKVGSGTAWKPGLNKPGLRRA